MPAGFVSKSEENHTMAFETMIVLIVAIMAIMKIAKTVFEKNPVYDDDSEIEKKISEKIGQIEKRLENLETLVLDMEKEKKFSEMED